MREFSTGATRNPDRDRPDYEGFLSPLVVEEFGRFMHAKRFLKDGSMRDSDNWQKGIPQDSYIKSGFRHFIEWWSNHRRLAKTPPDYPRHWLKETLTALMFNVMGYLHEELKAEEAWRGRQANSGILRDFRLDDPVPHPDDLLLAATALDNNVVTVQGHDDTHNHPDHH
jgi:hypothetical protein